MISLVDILNNNDGQPSEISARDTDEYLEQVFQFLVKYSWVYDIKLTEFITKRTWEEIPDEWKEALVKLSNEKLQKLPFPDFKRDELPHSLLKYLENAEHLSLIRSVRGNIPPVKIPDLMKRGMNPKKYHEVSHMASFIGAVCRESNCSAVLDVGSGLGYLGNVLSEQCGLNVLGLESMDDRSNGAKVMSEKKCISASKVDTIKFQLMDTEESFTELQNIIKRYFFDNKLQSKCNTQSSSDSFDSDNSCHDKSKSEIPGKRSAGVCMVGLHCCGSLTPAMLKLMAVTPHIRSLVCVSCCYHSIPVDEVGFHTHFPMSRQVHNFMSKVKQENANWRLGQYGLRLAAQETRARWYSQSPEDHVLHAKHVAYRGIIESWANTMDVKIIKGKRSIAKKKDYSTFSSYLETVLQSTSLKDYPRTIAEKSLLETYEKYHQYFKYIEPFTALQVIMQPVIETLIVIDRILYLHEVNIKPCVTPIFDEFISPRNLALIVK